MGVKFMKKGKEAQKEIEKQDALAAQKSSDTVFRFWLPVGGETAITFLDGDLDEDGLLDVGMYYEHQVYMNGDWRNWFVCTADEEPCPICEGGDKPSLVGAFTVIDHSEYESKGKHYKDQVRLFVAKRDTVKKLQKIATKRGGLAGCRFDVSRTGDKSPNVGDMFDFTDKRPLSEVLEQYNVDGPLDYEKHIIYRPAADLRKLGFGTVPVGAESNIPNYEDEL